MKTTVRGLGWSVERRPAHCSSRVRWKYLRKKGPDLPVIDDFIAAAGVARGTFYNYFNTTSELLAAVTGEMSDEVLSIIDPEVFEI
ncbi:TetR/AcrR family transcriptional regulator [Undibacterium arcticum]